MRGLYYALVGVYTDLSYAARLGRYHGWRTLMGIAAWLDIRLVRLHTHCHRRAARLRRQNGE